MQGLTAGVVLCVSKRWGPGQVRNMQHSEALVDYAAEQLTGLGPERG